MYNVIRLIIGCIFLVCSITAIKKSKVIRKHILYIVREIRGIHGADKIVWLYLMEHLMSFWLQISSKYH